MHCLAEREPGVPSVLNFQGRYFRVAVIFVAMKVKLEAHGLAPYRKRAKRYLYQDKYDAVYLMARDENIDAVERLAADLESDGRVEKCSKWVYPLRRDFQKRKLKKERAIVVCLRRRHAPGETPPSPEVGEDDDLPEEEFKPVLRRPSRGARSG